jgi:ABC-2 type transport system permease protein
VFFPLLSSPNNHPINKNLNMIRTEFISSMDTLPAYPGLEKEVLLTSSSRSATVQAPAMVSLSEIASEPDPRSFTQSHLITGVLLEGQFQSVFKNRFVNDLERSTGLSFRETSRDTRMVVLSDGDMIRNKVRHRPDGTMISELGYDQYTRQTYGNKDFLINAVHYLADKQGLIDIRAKEVKMRLLDTNRVREERATWQLINVGLPILLIILFGVVKNMMRQRKYKRF